MDSPEHQIGWLPGENDCKIGSLDRQMTVTFKIDPVSMNRKFYIYSTKRTKKETKRGMTDQLMSKRPKKIRKNNTKTIIK